MTSKSQQTVNTRISDIRGSHSISSYPRKHYEEFFEMFFLLAHQKVKETTRIAFLNADWRDFQSIPALKENEGNAITIFDYHCSDDYTYFWRL